MNFEAFEQDVAYAVRETLGHYDWFRGVCIDGLKEYHRADDLQGGIEHARMETIYFDAPNQGFDL